MITDQETGWIEASITINGRLLTFAEAMTFRVAVSSFRMSLATELAREQLGTVAGGYDDHLSKLEAYLLSETPTPATPK